MRFISKLMFWIFKYTISQSGEISAPQIIIIINIKQFFISALTASFSLKSTREQVSVGLQDSSKYSSWSKHRCGLNSIDSSSDPQFILSLFQTLRGPFQGVQSAHFTAKVLQDKRICILTKTLNILYIKNGIKKKKCTNVFIQLEIYLYFYLKEERKWSDKFTW